MSDLITGKIRKLNIMENFDFSNPKRIKISHRQPLNEIINIFLDTDDESLDESMNSYVSTINEINFGQTQLTETQEDCLVCMAPFNSSELIDLHAGHFKMCSECLRSQANALLRNRDLLPWKCSICSEEISLNILQNYMEPRDYDTLVNRQIEISLGETISCQNCNNTFLIPDDHHNNSFYCDICNNEIIIRDTTNELDDDNINLLYQLADELNWAQCPGCSELVEKNEGCNSMHHRGCNGGDTYFCYECDEILDNRDVDSQGRDHFPSGSFGHCINTINGLTRINPINSDEDEEYRGAAEEYNYEESDEEEYGYEDSDDNTVQSNDYDTLHYCTICNYEGKKFSSLQQHIRATGHYERFNCTRCNYSGLSEISLNQHIRATGHYERFYCIHCNYSSLNQSSLNQHINDTGHF